MKLIGVELRVGFRDAGRKLEAKLFPAEIRFPPSPPNGSYPVAEVTFHTTEGDVTVEATLPQPYVDRQQCEEDPYRRLNLLRAELEGSRVL